MKEERHASAVSGVVAAVTIAVAGCTPPSNGWTEEVELASGEVIVVMRSEAYRSNTELSGRTNVWVDSAELTLTDARTGAAPPPLKASEYLVRLDFDAEKRQWYVIGAVEDCRQAQRQGLGNRPYYEYRLQGRGWERRPVSPEHVGISANLLISKKLAEGGLPVKLDDKKRADTSVSLPDYLKRVLDKVPC